MNLAQFKKRLKAGVTQLHAINHKTIVGREDGTNKAIYGDKDLGIRTVSIVQSNSFALKTTKTDGKIVDSWCAYPKASEIVVNNENSITILESDGLPVLTYNFID